MVSEQAYVGVDVFQRVAICLGFVWLDFAFVLKVFIRHIRVGVCIGEVGLDEYQSGLGVHITFYILPDRYFV